MASVELAIEQIGRGGIVLVTDDEDRENEGDFIMAAEAANVDHLAFFLRHTSGIFCVPLAGERCDDLRLPAMVRQAEDPLGTAFTVSVDHVDSSTGISAAERARTVSALADPLAGPELFRRPGNIFPLRARTGGVLKRAGHTEAAVDLARLAGLTPAGLLCEVVSADKTAMAQGAELAALARKHDLPMISVAALVSHRLRTEKLIEHESSARIPTPYGDFECNSWRSTIDGIEHLALVRGKVDGETPVLVRVHSECLTGDVFGSQRCDCGTQLDDSMRMIAAAGSGVIVYLRGHEGRGIGISHKLAAYNLQDEGYDTVDANLRLGFPADSREYGIGAQILVELGVSRMRLVTNNPAKYSGLDGYGLEIVERIPLPPQRTAENASYLDTKRDRMGHIL